MLDKEHQLREVATMLGEAANLESKDALAGFGGPVWRFFLLDESVGFRAVSVH
jgi:hypothetical protein